MKMEIDGQQTKSNKPRQPSNTIDSIHKIIKICGPHNEDGTEENPWQLPIPINGNVRSQKKEGDEN